jgi:apolipoprotein N-acyltransferase
MLFGFIFNAFSFTWLYTAYPLIWMPPGIVQLAGIFILHVTLAVVASLGYLVVGWVVTLPTRKSLRPLLFAGSLTVAEIIRSLVISLLFKGEESTIAFHYTSSSIGNAIAVTPFVEFAYFGGVFALTFTLGYFVYICSSLYTIQSYWKHGVTFLILLFCIHTWLPTYGPQFPMRIGVVTTNFATAPDEQIISSFALQNKTLDNLTRSLASSHPDIIVYPEDARYIEYLPNEKKEHLLETFPKTLFIDGNTNVFQGKMVNVSLFYFSESKKILARGKSFLLPFNEFIPLFFKPIFSFFVPHDQMDSYIYNHTYTPIHSKKTITYNNTTIGTLLCSEILSHSTIQEVRDENPTLVFFQSHLNVFHDNPIAWAMLKSSASVAAAQLRRPLISSINGAPSFIVSPYGEIIKTIPTSFSTSTFIFSK